MPVAANGANPNAAITVVIAKAWADGADGCALSAPMIGAPSGAGPERDEVGTVVRAAGPATESGDAGTALKAIAAPLDTAAGADDTDNAVAGAGVCVPSPARVAGGVFREGLPVSWVPSWPVLLGNAAGVDGSPDPGVEFCCGACTGCPARTGVSASVPVTGFGSFSPAAASVLPPVVLPELPVAVLPLELVEVVVLLGLLPMVLVALGVLLLVLPPLVLSVVPPLPVVPPLLVPPSLSPPGDAAAGNAPYPVDTAIPTPKATASAPTRPT